MRSRLTYLLTAFFVALVLSQTQESVQAQNVYIVVSSSITHDAATNKVNGISRTTMDYRTNLYYRARAKGYIYTQNPSAPLAVSDIQGVAGQSVVSAQTQANASPRTVYNLKTEHYLFPLYCEAGCSYYLDYYNYYYSSPYAYWGAPSEFGATRTIYGCNPYPYQTCYPNIAYGWIWMGNTNTSILTPPALSITNSRVSGNLKGTTQNALLGSPAGLQASVNPTGLAGNYIWAFSGPYVQDFSSQDNSYRSIFWTQPGTYTATVTYSGSGFSVSATVTIQIRVPTLTSFSGTAGNNVVDRGRNCSNINSGQYLPFGATYTLGCYQNAAPTGMTWSATAMIPNVSYLSNPADAGIQFKQLVSVYRKRINKGRLECFTARNPQSDPATGWQLDGSDPYRNDVPTFYNATTVTAPPLPPEFDAPGVRLDGRPNDGSPPVEYEAFFTDDRFETYVYYFTGSPGKPSFVIPLHIADANCPADRLDCGVDRLVWRWGGQVHYDSAITGARYRETVSTTSVGAVPATRVGLVKSYSGIAQTNQYSLCQGAFNATNPIDGTRFFVLQLYLDVLHRTADQGGWDGWTSVIARCAFDTTCIHNNRITTARGFLESPENFANNPALANPGSHQYNREYVRLCYTSFLGRGPDQGGWDGWTNYIDNHPGDYNTLVGGFIDSTEYRSRFGTP
jgi:hypothetical protein